MKIIVGKLFNNDIVMLPWICTSGQQPDMSASVVQQSSMSAAAKAAWKTISPWRTIWQKILIIKQNLHWRTVWIKKLAQKTRKSDNIQILNNTAK